MRVLVSDCAGVPLPSETHSEAPQLYVNTNILGVNAINPDALAGDQSLPELLDVSDTGESIDADSSVLFGDGSQVTHAADSGDVIVPNSGCFGRAYDELFGGAMEYAIWIGFQNDFLVYVNERLDSDFHGEFRVLADSYQKCLVDLGYDFSGVDEVRDYVIESHSSAQASGLARDSELAELISADAQCQEQVDYANAVDQIALNAGEAWIESRSKNLADLAEWRAAVESRADELLAR